MAAGMLQVIASSYTIYSKTNFFFSPNSTEKYIVSKEYCFARHDDKVCFLANCRYHIILKDNLKVLPLKLDAFCFMYQHWDCLYTPFKYRFSGKVVVKSGQAFDNVQRAVHFNHRNRGVDILPIIAKRILLGKKYKKHFVELPPKDKLKQTSGSVFANRFEPVEKTNFKLVLIEIVDCFPDCHGKYTSNLVSFKNKNCVN